MVFQEFPFFSFPGAKQFWAAVSGLIGLIAMWWFKKMITRPQRRLQVNPAPHLTCLISREYHDNESLIDLSILILWSITSACASAAVPSPTSFWQIYSVLSKTDVKNDVRSLQPRPPYCIAMILSQALSFQIQWLDPVPEIKWIFLRIEWIYTH